MKCQNPDCAGYMRTGDSDAPTSKRYCSYACRQHAAYLRRKQKERLGKAIIGDENVSTQMEENS